MTGQELDLLELGRMPARCLIGENGPAGANIVAGRAYRGTVNLRREQLRRDYGKKLPWTDVVRERQSVG